MGRANMAQIAVRLIAEGLAAETPVLAICNGTQPDQRQVIAPLGEIAQAVADARFEGPVLFIIGAVAGLAAELGIDAGLAEIPPPILEAGHG